MTFKKALKAFFGARPPVEKGAEKRAKKRRFAAHGRPSGTVTIGLPGPKNDYGFKGGTGF